MNKNLKKVISAAAALTVSASSFAAFAATFPDVAEDASYAQAVQELSALGVINGFDDGTFGPDQLVTRGQMAKMIVDALNEGDQAAASAGSTQFTDAQGHWAVGYINQGVTDGWIAGYSSTQFGPDDNVTYVQAQKMIVAALGYSYYAEAAGGWPSGYKLYASQNDITVGVEGVASDDQELTRAQVAQMIDNGMDAPLCKITGWNVEWNGTQTPKITVKDKTGEDYQTLLTDRHDAYKVYGRVMDTNRTDSSLDTDKVRFRVEKADNFDDEYVKSTDEDTYVTEEMYFGDTDAMNMVRTYAQAIIQIDSDDDYTILSIVPAAANKTVELLSDDIDTSKSKMEDTVDMDKRVLYFYPTGTTKNSVKYELAESVDLYVNGVSMGENSFDVDAYNDYIVKNETNKVILQKETDPGKTSTSTKYNVIMIYTYTTGVVDEVNDKGDEVVITFKSSGYGYNAKSKMTIDKDDEDKTYSFTLNGEEIDPAELQEFDVLTIAYDTDDFADSDFYDVEVSRDTAEGKFTSFSSANKKWTVGGTAYKAACDMIELDENEDIANQQFDMDNSAEYTLYLDVFGRIAYVDELANSKKFGILKNVYQKTNKDWVAEVITKDGGSAIEYTLDDADGPVYEAMLSSATKKVDAYPYQVIEYKVSSSGKLTIKENNEKPAVVGCQVPAGGDTDMEYKESSGKIGSLKVSDNTVIIDISNVDKKKDDYKITSIDNLKDGQEYTAYGFDKSSNDSVYRLVVISDGFGGIDSTSELAIVVETSTDTNDEGDDVNAVTLFYQGDEVTFFVDDDSDADSIAENLVEGEPIVFSTNTSGDIDEIERVFANGSLLSDASRDSFLDLIDAFADADTATYSPDDWVDILSDGDQDNVQIKLGAVLKPNTGSNYTFAEATAMQVESDDIFVDLNEKDATFDFNTSDTTIYSYNLANNKKNAGRLELDNGMVYTPNTTAAYEFGDRSDDRFNIKSSELYNEEKGEYDVVLAVARTFDTDEVQEIYLIYVD